MDFTSLVNQRKIKPIGRTHIKDNKFFMNFSGSGVTFKTRGEKLIIKFYATKFDDKNSCPFVSVLIDDTRIDYKVDEEHKVIEIPMSSSIHNVTILKRTETSVSFLAIEEIIVDEFIALEEENKFKIEFYGDSLTCGFGNLSNNPEDKFSTESESFLDSYAYLLSQKLNADYSAICVSGFPIYKSRWNEGFPIDSVADMISICDYSEDMKMETSVPWDNSKFIPNLVVVNLGTNDCSYFTEGQKWVDDLIAKYGSFENVLNSEEMKKELVSLENKIISFLDDIFALYKKVKVIWALGMIYVNPHIQEVFDRVLNNYNNSNVYQFNFKVREICDERGAVYHPNKKMHLIASEELAEFIKEIYKW